jgi:hypothetical protein
MNGHTELVNCTLSTMLHAILKTNLRFWEECLPHVEFVYNRVVHSTTKFSPFQVVSFFIQVLPLPLPTSKILNFDASQCVDFI